MKEEFILEELISEFEESVEWKDRWSDTFRIYIYRAFLAKFLVKNFDITPMYNMRWGEVRQQTKRFD